MKEIVTFFALLGLFQFDVIAQDGKKGAGDAKPQNGVISGSNYEITKDTIIFLSDGREMRLFARHSSGSAGDMPFATKSVAMREFEQAQRQVMRQFNDDVSRFGTYYSRMEEEAQERDKQIRSQLHSQKVIMFTDIIGLTSDEARHFWPVYNEYSEKRDEIIKKRRMAINKLRNIESEVSDKQAESVCQEYLESLGQESELQTEYYKRYKGILSANKLLMLYKAEEDFKALLLRSRF